MNEAKRTHLGERVRAARDGLRLSQDEMAEVVGITRGQWSRYERGIAVPGGEVLSALAERGVDVAFLLTGKTLTTANVGFKDAPEGGAPGVSASLMDQINHLVEITPMPGGVAAWHPAMRKSTTAELSGQTHFTGSRTSLNSDVLGHEPPLVISVSSREPGATGSRKVQFGMIPKHTRVAAAGAGKPGLQGQSKKEIDVVGDMAFSFDWLKDNMSHTTGALTSIRVSGDSMSATLMDGDTIIIDMGVNHIDTDGIYVMDVYGQTLVKRVQRLLDGTLILISDNTVYERQTVTRDRARDVRVIGRMVWPRLR